MAPVVVVVMAVMNKRKARWPKSKRVGEEGGIIPEAECLGHESESMQVVPTFSERSMICVPV